MPCHAPAKTAGRGYPPSNPLFTRADTGGSVADPTTATKPIEKILAKYDRHQRHLVEILREVQHTYGFISRENVAAIAEYTEVTPTQVWGTMTFCGEIRTTPPGEHVVSICAGPACYCRGLSKLVDTAERTLGLKAGETSKDGRITLLTHHCNGICELSAVAHIDDKIYPNLNPEKLKGILEEIKKD